MDDLEKILSLYEHNEKWPTESVRFRFDREVGTFTLRQREVTAADPSCLDKNGLSIRLYTTLS